MAIEYLYFMASNKNLKEKWGKYEPKVKFEGIFEDMLRISARGAGVRKKNKRKKINQQ